MTNTVEIDRILQFLEQIGIETECRDIAEPTFLPGIKIDAGRLIIDLAKLKYPGDLLHEAGHIAVEPSERRAHLNDDVGAGVGPAQSLEIVTILWSYAALRYLNLPPEFVFHEGGYKGQSDWFIQQFESASYIGLPLIQWMGLAMDEKNAANMNVKPFPHMLKWLRD